MAARNSRAGSVSSNSDLEIQFSHPPSTRQCIKGMSLHRPSSELHRLCRNGDVELLASYLRDTVITGTVNQTGGANGCAPLHEAAIGGNHQIINLLHSELDYLDMNIRTTQGPASTPLHLAAQRGKAEAVIALVDNGALIECVDRCWRTPLDVAIEHKQTDVIHILKVYKMVGAVNRENIAVLEELLKETEAVDLSGSLSSWHEGILNQCLLKSSKIGNRKVVSLLVRYGARNFQECIDASPQTNHISAFLFLCLAAQDGDSEAIKIMLHSNEDDIMDLPRYDNLIMHRLILAPLLQNGRFSLSIPIHVALQAGQVAVAGEVVQLSSSRPSSGMIDWHDLEVNHIESNWFDIPSATHLVYIGLSSNKLRCLPERVIDFKSLQKLQIHHNCISSLPVELFNMPNLKVLDASFNKIVSLPEISRFPLTSSLENLNLAHNRLTDLPGYFINSKIVVLDVSSNRFNKVPDCVAHLHQMNTLCLDYNVGIEFIPYEIGNLRRLSILGLKGLPYLKNIPCTKDAPQLEFLKSRARSPQSFLHYDVAVVTNESYDVCRGRVIQAVQQHSRRKHHSCIVYNDPKQFLYFQKAFSLSCTVYVLVWDCEGQQPADDIFPILTHLAMYAPNTRIIVASCWMEAINSGIQSVTKEQVDKSLWKDWERRGLLTLMTICVDKDALVSRSNSLQYLTDIIHRKGEVGGVHLNIPNSYVALQGMLQHHANSLKQEGNPPMIDEQQLWGLIKNCPHNDMAGFRELPILVSYLTDIASLVCLPSNRSTDSNIYILNRQWFLDALSGLLNANEHLRNASGLYPVHNLCDILSCPTLQTELPYAFCLFVSQLGLAITVTGSEVLVPAMLGSKNTETSSDFSSQYEVRRVYTLRQVPESFWGRLIAHLRINMDYLIHRTAIDSAGEVVDGIRHMSSDLPTNDDLNWTYWKKGMIVYISGMTLLFSIEAIPVITESEYREGIEISVRNTTVGTKAMNMITVTINSLLSNWYKELWQTVEIAVPCPMCAQSGSYTLFPFHECCTALAKQSYGSLYCAEHDQCCSAIEIMPDLVQVNGQRQTMFTTTEHVTFSISDKSMCLSPPPSETVFKGYFGKQDVAVKPFPPPIPNGEHSMNPFLDFWHEFTILNYISSSESSPYLIDLLVATINPLGLVFPLARFCSLDEVIQEKKIKLPPIMRLRILYQLAHALQALHSLKIIHRNVCLANIFVFSLSLDDTVNIRLGGLSDSCIAVNQGLAIGEYGTFPAPEMSKFGYQYDERVDVFAYGFTAYEILSRRKIKFRRGVRFQAPSLAADRPALNNISKIAPHFATTIEKCWNIDESKRPFFGEILTTFQNPLHTIIREGEGVQELEDFNAAAVRFTRNENGTFKGDLYLCSSVYSAMDSATLTHFSLPGLTLTETTSLPAQCIICMCCTAQYLWISFQHKYVRVYSTETLEYVKQIDFEHFVLSMAISPDAVYLGLENGEVQMYKMSIPNPLHSAHKTRVVSFKTSIDSIQVLEDCVICCTKRSCIRLHPETLHPEQEFPVISDTEVKFSVLCLDRERDQEFLWVSFRRLQQLVVFNALNGKAIYGFNTCEVLGMPKNDVWVTSMLSVLDTVWVGMNTGHALIFSAFSEQPNLLTYIKVHNEKIDCLMLLQPSYWGANTPYYYYGDLLTESEESEDIGDDGPSSLVLEHQDIESMPNSMLIMSIGRGIQKRIPKIGSDGFVKIDRGSLSPGAACSPTGTAPQLYLLLMDAPDAAGANKLEFQAHRGPVPYMVNYRATMTSTLSESCLVNIRIPDGSNGSNGSSRHRTIPKGLNLHSTPNLASNTGSSIPTPDIQRDLVDYTVVSRRNVPPTADLQTTKHNTNPFKRLSRILTRKPQETDQNGVLEEETPGHEEPNNTNHSRSTLHDSHTPSDGYTPMSPNHHIRSSCSYSDTYEDDYESMNCAAMQPPPVAVCGDCSPLSTSLPQPDSGNDHTDSLPSNPPTSLIPLGPESN